LNPTTQAPEIPSTKGEATEPTVSTAACYECGNQFPEKELLPYGKWNLCSNCKVNFAQKLAEHFPLGHEQAWKQKSRVILLADQVELPNRCVCCNEPGAVRNKTTFHYLSKTSRLIVAFFLVPALVLSILAMAILRKKETVTFSYCQKHSTRKSHVSALTAGLFIISFLFFLTFAVFDWGLGVFFGTVIVFFALAGWCYSRNPLYIHHRDDDRIELAGAGKKFRNSLEDWG